MRAAAVAVGPFKQHDPEAVIEAARQWALGLGSATEERPETAKQLVLPALRPLLAYAPVQPIRIVLPHVHQSEGDTESIPSARVSQLGEPPVPATSSPISAPPYVVAYAANSAYEAKIAADAAAKPRRSPGRSMANKAGQVVAAAEASAAMPSRPTLKRPSAWAPPPQRSDSTEALSPRQLIGGQCNQMHSTSMPPTTMYTPAKPKLLRHKTVFRPEDDRPVVRGGDPLGGSLFGRDAALDDVAKQRGIYEGQLITSTTSRRTNRK